MLMSQAFSSTPRPGKSTIIQRNRMKTATTAADALFTSSNGMVQSFTNRRAMRKAERQGRVYRPSQSIDALRDYIQLIAASAALRQPWRGRVLEPIMRPIPALDRSR